MKGKITFIAIALLVTAGTAPGAGVFGKSINAFDSSTGGDVHPTYATGQWFKIYSNNSSLWVSNYGTYGGETYFPDRGFRFNTGEYSDPENFNSTRCLTDSPSKRDYDPDMITVAYMPEELVLPSASSITLSYYAKWDIETDRDCCEVVYVTSASGVPAVGDWVNLQATSSEPKSAIPVQLYAGDWLYEDIEASWTLEQVDLSALAGQTIRLGFLFRSDQSNPGTTRDGIFIDELEVVADASPVYSADFDTVGDDDWSYHKYDGNGEGWGLSQSILEEILLIKNGQLCVGTSTAYVANRGDWGPLVDGVFTPTTLYSYYSNSGTVHVGDPEFSVQQYSYIFDDFAITDYYVTNISGDSFTNVYIGMGNNASIEFGNDGQGNERFHYEYDNTDDVGVWNNAGNEDGPMLGIIYLSDGDTTSYNVGLLDPANDATLYNNMSNGQHDHSGGWSADGRWINILGVGPFTMGPGMQRRFAVGFVGGDSWDNPGNNNLTDNIDDCTDMYPNLEDHIGIRSASLGEIKAMYR